MTQPERLWNIPVHVEDLPEQGRDFVHAADETVRPAIASAAGILALPRLEASFHLRSHGRGGVHVTGTVSATVQQSCVVTLEPLINEVTEAVDVTFLPPGAANAAAAEEVLEPGSPEPPEVLADGTIDLGALAVEFLLLGIDPYPRKPGAVFDAPSIGAGEANPFAALAALKKPPSGKD
jgi:uncharacterized metal-binding protein YceD (DUF177 family)